MSAQGPVVSREEKQRACEVVLKSRTFSRSEQLQAFLRYICEMEIADRGDEITEYSIATNALGRRPDYAPSEDSSVRSRAHALRRKLQDYYESEATDAADLRIDLPKGSYRPRFLAAPEPPVVTAAASQPLTDTALPTEPIAPSPATTRPLVLAGLIGASVALAIAAVAWFTLSPNAVDAVVREAWGPMLTAGSDALLVIGCPPLARVLPSAPGSVPRGNIMLPTPDAINKWYSDYNLESRGGPLYMFPTRGYTLFSDTLAAAQLSSLLNSAGVSVQAIPEVTFRPMAVHERGMVLIGSPAYTQFIARVQKVTPFAIRYDPSANDEEISDALPSKPRTTFKVRRDPGTQRFATIYGLITVLPSQPGRDRPQRTIIFSGIMGSPGAQAGIQYFTSPAALRDLKARFRREGHDSFPPAYQVVVRSGVDADAAINAVYETHRVLSSVPVIE